MDVFVNLKTLTFTSTHKSFLSSRQDYPLNYQWGDSSDDTKTNIAALLTRRPILEVLSLSFTACLIITGCPTTYGGHTVGNSDARKKHWATDTSDLIVEFKWTVEDDELIGTVHEVEDNTVTGNCHSIIKTFVGKKCHEL
jgi:hypothetical protein